jgi:hypothetical protein
MFSQPLPAAFSGRQMTVLLGLTSAPASFLSAENVWRWPWIQETMPLPERLVAEYFGSGR